MSRLQYSLKDNLIRYSKKRFVSFKKDFAYERYNYSDILDYSLRFITFLKDQKIKPGDRIAICSYNSPEYFYVFLGSLFYNVTLVPIDYGSSPELISNFMKKTNSKVLITSKKKIIDAKKVFVEDLEELIKSKNKGSVFRAKEDDLVEILFTSGTTGEPKGVMLTHKNLYSNITSVFKVLNIRSGYRLLSMLPLSHVFEQVAGFLALAFRGASTIHLKSKRPSEIIKVMQHEKTNVIATVPAFYILFQKKIEEKIKNKGKFREFEKIQKIAKYLPLPLKRAVFKKIHDVFGSHLKIAICGAASLPEETEEFWENIGVKVLKGYGLTETSPVLTITRENDRKLRSVGTAIPGVELKLNDEKEILAKGENTSPGYYKNDDATKKLYYDEWLRTGDIGEFDSSGHLYIKGRLKNMILKPNGLNIYPEDIEKILDRFDEIKESCVIGVDAGHDVITTAVLLIEKDAKENEIKTIIDKANEALEEHQKIQDHFIWKKKDFPRTLTLKVIRRKILEEIEKKTVHTESKDELLHILSELCHVDADKIKEESKIFFDLGFDSIKVIELSTYIEEKLRIEIDEYKINNDTNVRDLRELVITGVDNKNKLKLDKALFFPIFIPIRIFIAEFFYFLASFYFKKVEIIGKSNLKDVKGQFIVIINHSSHLDFPTLAKHFPLKLKTRLAMGAAADYFFKDKSLKDKLISKFFYCFFGAFPLSRPKNNVSSSSIKQSFDFIGEIIDRGWSIGLSPEGTRSLNGKLGNFKSGIGIIVKETKLPVIPVKLEGLHDIMPPNSRFPMGKGDVTIKFGRPVYFPDDKNVVEITKELEGIIRRM